MFLLFIVNNIRRSQEWLTRNGLTPDMPGVFPLRDDRPDFDPRLEYIIDGGTGGDERAGFYIDWIVEDLPADKLAASLPRIKADKLAEILAGANAMSATVKAKYSNPEIDSWQRQEAEARALLADLEAPAPLVRDLAANAGTTPLDFAGRIVGNADAAAAATKAIILQQQGMEKALALAESVEAVQAVTVNYSLEV